MRVAGSLEKASEHPLGAAVLEWMTGRVFRVAEVSNLRLRRVRV